MALRDPAENKAGLVQGEFPFPPKQTWNLKMDPWTRRFLLETHHFQVPC